MHALIQILNSIFDIPILQSLSIDIFPSGVILGGLSYSGGKDRKAMISGCVLAKERKGSMTKATHGLPAPSSLRCQESWVLTSWSLIKQCEWAPRSNGWEWYHPMKFSLRVYMGNVV